MENLNKTIKNFVVKYGASFKKEFSVNVSNILKNEYYPKLVDRIVEWFNLLPIGPNNDPTSLEKWVGVFKSHLLEQVDNSILIKEGELSIELGDKRFLGYGREDDTEAPDPIIWMVYFIADTAAQGIAGRFAFISKTDFEKVRGAGKYKEKWGRFGLGFMISKDEFNDEGWDKVLGSFESNEHPLSKFLGSGEGPLNIFQKAFEEQEDSEDNLFFYIDKAINTTIKRL